MKYTKIFALFLGALSLTACSDKEEFNTASGVTVEMGQSEITAVETQDMLNIPVIVKGDANGPITVRLKIEATGDVPVKPFEDIDGNWSGNYIVTSETLNIPAGENQVSMEVRLVDDFDKTGDWTFNVSIVSCDGATVGSQSTTVVTVLDNEAFPPYDLIQGKWKFNFKNGKGAAASYNVTVSGYPEGTTEYAKGYLELAVLLNNPTVLSLYLTEDEANDKVYVSMVLPEPIIWYDDTNYVWVIGKDNASGKWTFSKKIVTGEFDRDKQTITFAPEDMIGFYVATPDLSSAMGFYETASDITFTRK